MLKGKTFSSDKGSGLTGTMPNVGSQDMMPGTTAKGIDKGYHDGTGKVYGDADLEAGNIRSGVDIFGVTGTSIQAGGAATDDQVLDGVTYSNTSGASTGTMPDYSGADKKVYTPSDSVVNIHNGYHEGSTVATDANLLPDNIIDGVTIFGVMGRAQCVTESTADAVRQLCYDDCAEIFPGLGPEWAGCLNGCSSYRNNLLTTYQCN